MSLKDVVRRYGAGPRSTAALQNITLQVQAGEFLVVLGPSGCGKSTLLRCLAGIEAYEGDILIGAEERRRIPPARLECEWLPQSVAETFLPHLTIMQNLALSARLRGARPPTEQDRTNAARQFGIDHLLGRQPREVSGGELQRAALCRAVLGRPSILLLDEPLASIDQQHRSEIRGLIRRARERSAPTTICVTHDTEDALWLADRCALMKGGAIEQVGTPEEIVRDPFSEFVLGFFGAPELNDVSKLTTVTRKDAGTAVLGAKLLIRARDLCLTPQGAPPPGRDLLWLGAARRRHSRWMGDHFRIEALWSESGNVLVAHARDPVPVELDVYADRAWIYAFDTAGERLRAPWS